MLPLPIQYQNEQTMFALYSPQKWEENCRTATPFLHISSQSCIIHSTARWRQWSGRTCWKQLFPFLDETVFAELIFWICWVIWNSIGGCWTLITRVVRSDWWRRLRRLSIAAESWVVERNYKACGVHVDKYDCAFEECACEKKRNNMKGLDKFWCSHMHSKRFKRHRSVACELTVHWFMSTMTLHG